MTTELLEQMQVVEKDRAMQRHSEFVSLCKKKIEGDEIAPEELVETLERLGKTAQQFIDACDDYQKRLELNEIRLAGQKAETEKPEQLSPEMKAKAAEYWAFKEKLDEFNARKKWAAEDRQNAIQAGANAERNLVQNCKNEHLKAEYYRLFKLSEAVGKRMRQAQDLVTTYDSHLSVAISHNHAKKQKDVPQDDLQPIRDKIAEAKSAENKILQEFNRVNQEMNAVREAMTAPEAI